MLNNYHPRSAAIYLFCWFILALFINDLKVLTLMTLLVIIINFAEDRAKALSKIMLFIMPLTLFIAGFNLLLADYGQAVFYTFNMPLAGEITIYQEPLANSLAMGVKLLLLISIFNIFNLVITADNLFSVFGAYSGSAVLLAVLARRMVPWLGSEARSIYEVQTLRIRGAEADSLLKKVKNAGPFLTNLLRATLESSLHTAEAMQLRAYGSGKRTYFVPEKWQSRDTFITLTALTVLVFFICDPFLAELTGYSVFILPIVLTGSQLAGGLLKQ
ncbi:MAG: energy-coupling factor transporter transmembrane protein EcfT [Syntrophomonadaceae bacterium]|jgi:energy-coupling factor transport system permease protein|nr:energy-coupling factor transporter transmembrane protein EcfT [Syntrophomonadaceae bacterium]